MVLVVVKELAVCVWQQLMQQMHLRHLSDLIFWALLELPARLPLSCRRMVELSPSFFVSEGAQPLYALIMLAEKGFPKGIEPTLGSLLLTSAKSHSHTKQMKVIVAFAVVLQLALALNLPENLKTHSTLLIVVVFRMKHSGKLKKEF